MNWDDVRHFVMLSRVGSLSEAARRLDVDHTTVARRISALETSLGLRLVHRLPRSYSLTEDGQRIAALGESMEAQAFALLRDAQAADTSLAGTVRISAPPVYASAVLAPRMVALRRRHSALVIELAGESHHADLDRREADLALRLSRPQGVDLVVRKIGELAYGLYGAPDYLAATDPADWVFLAYDSSLDQVPQQTWLYDIAAGRPVVFRSNSVAHLAAAAQTGLGLAAVPDFLARTLSGLVRVPPDGPPPPARDLWLAVHDDLRRSPRIRAVMDFLVETATGAP